MYMYVIVVLLLNKFVLRCVGNGSRGRRGRRNLWPAVFQKTEGGAREEEGEAAEGRRG